MNIPEIEELLKKFDSLPKKIKQPTYLELSKYPYNRFEEIISRLLCFYMSPLKEHGFRDLFLRSLFDIIDPDKSISYDFHDINVISEENAEGKRLDILIRSNGFVIGIENKITAGLYNPLEIYKKQIEMYSGDKYNIVLTLRSISNKEQLDKLRKNKFKNITYSDFFSRVKANLGNFIIDGDSKYLIFMTDLIQTIENMNGENILNLQLREFFFDNENRINDLMALYDEYNKLTESKQADRISAIKDIINNKTDGKWSIYDGLWLEHAESFNPNKPRIGIAATFASTKGNPLGAFHIYISTWSLMDWNFYEETILTRFPSGKPEIGKKVEMHIATILNDDEDSIMTELEKLYNYLLKITRD